MASHWCWCCGVCWRSSLGNWCSTIFALAFTLSLAFAFALWFIQSLGLCSPWDDGIVNVLGQFSERSTGIINNWNWDRKRVGSSTDWVRNWIGWAADGDGVSASSWWWTAWAWAVASSWSGASWWTSTSAACRAVSIEVIDNRSFCSRVTYVVAH
jgi:hypothetical protein